MRQVWKESFEDREMRKNTDQIVKRIKYGNRQMKK